MSISVIVSNFNGQQFLPRLLQSLREQRNVTTQVVIVDRHSRDDSLRIIRRYADISVIQVPPELGLVAGYAAGVSLASHEHLFFCNEDMWFDPNCLSFLLGHLSIEQRIGIADPWQWDYAGRNVIHMGNQMRRRWDANSPLPTWTMEQTARIESGQPTAMACAGAMMIARLVYEDLGGWDTSFFLDYEDLDICIRAWQKGWRCVIVPEAKVYHAVGASNSKTLAGKRTVGQKRYVAGASNCLTVAGKYFSLRCFLLAVMARLEKLLRNLIRVRFRSAKFDVQALWTTLLRLPDVLRFRRANRAWNRVRPGEDYFREPSFQLTRRGNAEERSSPRVA